jgi:lipopolysaccharide transport system permease protein
MLSMEKTQVAVYTPKSHLGFGWRIWKEMFIELIHSRSLIWRLFLRDLSAMYRQSLFGYVWAIMPAILMVVTFTVLNNSGTLPIGKTSMPYPVYVLLGMTVWLLFSTGLIRSANSLVNARAIITQINLSRETLVIAAFCEAVFEFLIRSVLLLAFFWWYKILPTGTIFLIPLILLPLSLMTMGLGFLLALANGVFRDVANSLTMLLTFAMFLTPVVYPPPSHGLKVLINYLNPVSPFIIATRDMAIYGTISQPISLFWASIFGIVIFFVCWRIFHLAMWRVVERV